MHYSPPNGARLYRVTGAGNDSWPNPVSGQGAYFTKGGRYNRVSQPTVYCSEDVLVVIAETAFYQALTWHQEISRYYLQPVNYPLISSHRLWCFSIDPSPNLIDLEHPNTLHQFQYPAHLTLNPSLNPRPGPQLAGQVANRDYLGTQELADQIRAWIPQSGSPHPRPEGLKAPAIRLQRRGSHQPHQLALFVFDSALNVNTPYEQRSNLIGQWNLTLEFLQSDPRTSVTQQTIYVDWSRPRFRLVGTGAGTIPAYAPRPNAVAYRPNRWYAINILYV